MMQLKRKFTRKCIIGLVVGIVAAPFVVLEVLSLSATAIFNRAMAEQTMLVGTITAEKISADMWGNIDFEGFLWLDAEGHKLLEIPEGSFKVKLWDIVRGKYKATTLEYFYIRGAGVSLYLNDKMELDVVRRSGDFHKMNKLLREKDHAWRDKVSLVNKNEDELKEVGRRRREMQMQKAQTDLRNFNLDNRNMKLNLLLEDCKLEVVYAGRHYLLNHVRANAEIDTEKSISVDVQADGFGGDAIGQSAILRGMFDVSEPDTECSVILRMQKIDPSSLGLGNDLHDPLSLDMNFYGTADDIRGDGQIRMAKLHLPGLEFSDVSGNITYADGKFKFSDVKAKVFDGDFTAQGDYDVDTRYYSIAGKGTKLEAAKALPDGKLSCKVDLNLTLNSQGSHKTTYVAGDFVTGEATYQWWWLKFDRMQGRFTNAYNDLRFYDVKVFYGPYVIQTDSFNITNKKLHLDPIDIVDENGNSILTYYHNTREAVSHR